MIAKVLGSDISWHRVGGGQMLLHCAEDVSSQKRYIAFVQ